MQTHNSCGLCSITLKDIQVVSGQDTLLDNINLQFHCGELTALIGKNGAGKTTLLKAILGERPYKGEISYQDHHGAKIIQPKIGYVPQQMDFDRSTPVSVSDFMAAARGKSPVWWKIGKSEKKQIQEMLEDMNCAYLADRRLGALSGGELQRVLLALATNPVPDLLILDEPVSGLDPKVTAEMYHLIEKLNQQEGITVLMISHDIQAAVCYASHILHVGETIFFGTREAYLQSPQGRLFAAGKGGAV